jgi:hypothetical protein
MKRVLVLVLVAGFCGLSGCGGPNESGGVDSLSSRDQRIVRGFAGDVRRAIAQDQGSTPDGAEDDLSCSTWLGTSEALLAPPLTDLVSGITGSASKSTIDAYAKAIYDGCGENRGGSALDPLADAIGNAG